MTTFESNIQNIYGEKGKAWLRSLSTLIDNTASRLGLCDLKPISNLSYNYVLSGFQGDRPIILKVGLDICSLKKEAFALRCFAGLGAVKVMAEEDGLILLERAVPGTSLKSYFLPKEAENIEIACRVMKQLHKAKVPQTHCFPHIKDWLAALDKDWEVPLRYLEKARQLRDRLLQMPSQDVLLHGDLHHDNILQNDDQWIAIDPKGVIGPPIFETWAFVMNMEKDTEFIANFFRFDLQDVRDWYFVHLILAVCWNLEDNIDSTLFMGLAEKAYQLK